jgi:hypothetical protein
MRRRVVPIERAAYDHCPRTGKLSFPSPQAAEHRRKALKQRRNERVSSYRCVFCHRWHLGHSDFRKGVA